MAGLTPAYLRCEYLVDPLGIDAVRPRLSWLVQSDQRNQRQTGRQVLVSDSRETLDREVGTLWDSGKVETDETAQLYAGRPLKSRQQCYWKVRVWDHSGLVSEWSPTALWTMGLLEQQDWHAQWIGYDAPYGAVLRSGHLATGDAGAHSLAGVLLSPVKVLLRTARALGRWAKSASSGRIPKSLRGPVKKILVRAASAVVMRRVSRFQPVLPPCPYLRKEFSCANVVRATLYASALGLYELQINGRRVGDAYFTPGWTDYGRRVYYQTYDVTGFLREGPNGIGAILADGWYAGYLGPWGKRAYYGVQPWLIAQLEIEGPDGSVATVVTDSTWKATVGPHVEADLLMGETYDARLEMPGWSEAGCTSSAWSPVTVAGGITTSLQAMHHPPVRKTDEVKPVRMWAPSPGRHVFDMGQNFSGWVRLKVNGPAGTRVVLRFAERLNPDNTIYRANLRGARATDTYVLRGGEEEWEPRFTYHGFQYVEVTGYPGPPELEAITGIVAHSTAPKAGWFECSAPMVNKLYDNIVWTQRANFIDIPTDCPQRDERLGWLADAQVFARTATYNMDLASLLGKWLVDVADAQSREGAYPEVAPRWPGTGVGTPGWADAGIICPWIVYQVYGDRGIIERHYEGMKSWVEYIHEANPELLWTKRTGQNLGDWLARDEGTPKELLATAYFAYDTSLLARMASVIGRTQDAQKYERLSRAIQGAFSTAYVAQDGRVNGETQTCYALALHFGLVPEALRSGAATRLVEAIGARNGHLSTGFFGTAYLLHALAANEHLDTAYRLLLNETFPSWGYWIRQGATSLWERWDGWTEKAGFQAPLMNSFSHYAFGSVGEWLFATVAGIDTEGPGFKRLVVRPRPGGGLTYAKAYYDCVNGRVATHWRIQGDVFHLDVMIPTNTTATVFIPARDVQSVTEGDRPITAAGDIEVKGIHDGSVVLRIGSGRYHFRAGMRA